MSNEELNENIESLNASSTSSGSKDPCCGPFKRGKPGRATDPRMQCFADCCNICPPDDCCDSVTIHFECGCPPPSDLACECSSTTSFNFGGIKFKRKKLKLPDIPKFSQETQNENGFIFSQAGTVPTPYPTETPTETPTPTPTETPYTTPTHTPTETPYVTETPTETPTPTPTPTCYEPCSKIQVTLTTTGCCLYLGPGGVEAVGSGIVTAEISGTRETCELMLILNGQTGNTVLVEDGDSISVEIQTNGDCECCETQRDCNTTQSSTNLWVTKNKSLVLNRNLMMQKIASVARRVKN